MREKLKKLWNQLRCGCESWDDYNLIADLRNEFNHRMWKNVTLISIIYFLVAFATSFSLTVVRTKAVLYGVMLVISLIMHFLLYRVVRDDSPMLMPIVYSTCAALLLFGVVIGTWADDNLPAVTYFVLLIALTLVLADIPARMGILESVITVIFLVFTWVNETGEVRSMDLYNGIAFWALAQVINLYISTTNMHQFLLTKRMELASITDGLTGLLNRMAFEKDWKQLQQKGMKGFVYAALDVNGLKRTNDTIGHEAGDELLRAAAVCMTQAFGAYGKIYRMGGDEYTALIRADGEKLAAAQAEFERLTKGWEGTLIHGLSVSAGYVNVDEYPDAGPAEIIRMADKRMYEAKSLYYIENGLDRRKR